jgi:hypothetical protein
MKKSVLSVAMGGVLLAAAPAWAHHSHAMFDTSKDETLAGTVKDFSFANPHLYLLLLTPDKSGKIIEYSVEMSTTQNMERDGVGPNTFKPGDKVTIRVSPLKSGRPGGSYTGAIDAAGGKHGTLADRPARAG